MRLIPPASIASMSPTATETTTAATLSNQTIMNATGNTIIGISLQLTNVSRPCHVTAKCDCASSQGAANLTRGMLSDEGSLDALLYIVVVLLFYAFSIVVLMVKYIRRENKEADLRQYFEEFVTRDQFQSAQARNQMCMKSLLDRQMDPDLLGQITPSDRCLDRLEECLDTPLCIPHVISELEEDMDFESAEDELNDETVQVTTAGTNAASFQDERASCQDSPV